MYMGECSRSLKVCLAENKHAVAKTNADNGMDWEKARVVRSMHGTGRGLRCCKSSKNEPGLDPGFQLPIPLANPFGLRLVFFVLTSIEQETSFTIIMYNINFTHGYHSSLTHPSCYDAIALACHKPFHLLTCTPHPVLAGDNLQSKRYVWFSPSML